MSQAKTNQQKQKQANKKQRQQFFAHKDFYEGELVCIAF